MHTPHGLVVVRCVLLDGIVSMVGAEVDGGDAHPASIDTPHTTTRVRPPLHHLLSAYSIVSSHRRLLLYSSSCVVFFSPPLTLAPPRYHSRVEYSGTVRLNTPNMHTQREQTNTTEIQKNTHNTD